MGSSTSSAADGSSGGGDGGGSDVAHVRGVVAGVGLERGRSGRLASFDGERRQIAPAMHHGEDGEVPASSLHRRCAVAQTELVAAVTGVGREAESNLLCGLDKEHVEDVRFADAPRGAGRIDEVEAAGVQEAEQHAVESLREDVQRLETEFAVPQRHPADSATHELQLGPELNFPIVDHLVDLEVVLGATTRLHADETKRTAVATQEIGDENFEEITIARLREDREGAVGAHDTELLGRDELGELGPRHESSAARLVQEAARSEEPLDRAVVRPASQRESKAVRVAAFGAPLQRG
mmetsp:Transcript_22327/g.69938  ORF Transcript_22327/g.69938 Transcript_22327/m.69938 type:complete len:295 (-) Transcript_22327:3396-4280(-)